MRFAGLGVQLAVTMVAGVLGGQWVDHRIGTEAVFTLLGALAGFGLTLWSLFRELKRK